MAKKSKLVKPPAVRPRARNIRPARNRSSELERLIPPHPNEIARPARSATLTDREREVLKSFAAGHTYLEIAEQLEISPKTVGSYLQRVREKCRAKNRAGLIALAIEQGLLDIGKAKK